MSFWTIFFIRILSLKPLQGFLERESCKTKDLLDLLGPIFYFHSLSTSRKLSPQMRNCSYQIQLFEVSIQLKGKNKLPIFYVKKIKSPIENVFHLNTFEDSNEKLFSTNTPLLLLVSKRPLRRNFRKFNWKEFSILSHFRPQQTGIFQFYCIFIFCEWNKQFFFTPLFFVFKVLLFFNDPLGFIKKFRHSNYLPEYVYDVWFRRNV